MVHPNIKIKCICGNCDRNSTAPTEQISKFNGKRVFFTHGHKYYVKHGYSEILRHAREVKADICLFGHTYIPYTKLMDGIQFMNPGAVCQGSCGIVDVVPGELWHTR